MPQYQYYINGHYSREKCPDDDSQRIVDEKGQSLTDEPLKRFVYG